jgi:histidinol-phosphatase
VGLPHRVYWFLMPYERELEFARRAAARAGENAVRLRAAGFETAVKPDDSPVTSADRDNERLLAEMIAAEFPEDGILGEEGTSRPGTSGRRWIVDPIDGTRDFVRGNRLWCVLVALEDAGEPVVGTAHFPLLEETCWASRGGGAYRNGRRLRVSEVVETSQAVLSPNGLHAMAAEPYGGDMMAFMSRFWAVRSAGGALDAVMLAAGEIDVWLERKAEIWDLAPLQVIIEEAGGRFFALDGSRRPDRGNAVACAPGLESVVRAFFGLA